MERATGATPKRLQTSGRGALLESIAQGTTLRKVEVNENRKKDKEIKDGMGFNIAMILQRREAIEMTDSDEEDSEEEWDDEEERLTEMKRRTARDL